METLLSVGMVVLGVALILATSVILCLILDWWDDR